MRLILSIFCLAVLLCPAEKLQAQQTVVTLDRLGNLAWQLPFTNGLVAIESTTNLSGIWTPHRAMIVTNSTGNMFVGAAAATRFWRVIAADATNSPPGMRPVPAGYFLMGDGNTATFANEKPLHWVYISDFFIDQYEITNEQMRDMLQWALARNLISVNNSKMVRSAWSVVTNLVQCKGLIDATAHNQVTYTNGVFGIEEGKTNNPCVGISWFGAIAFCNWRSEREGLEPCYNLTNWTCDFSKNGYRLPTEAEWEKAARGGKTGQNYPWDSPANPGVSWPSQINTNMATYTPVGLPHPFTNTAVGHFDGVRNAPGPDTMNGYGLYDVVGNVREWCWDWYRGDWYAQPEASQPDPVGPDTGEIIVVNPSTSGPTRITRGGSFDENQKNVRCSFRGQPYQSLPHLTHWYHGMRCVRRR